MHLMLPVPKFVGSCMRKAKSAFAPASIKLGYPQATSPTLQLNLIHLWLSLIALMMLSTTGCLLKFSMPSVTI